MPSPLLPASLAYISINAGGILDIIPPQDSKDAYTNIRETQMASKKKSRKAAPVRKQPAHGRKDRSTLEIAIAPNADARHLHIVGKPGSGKAVPMLLLIGRPSGNAQ